jgi:hypothetical protein
VLLAPARAEVQPRLGHDLPAQVTERRRAVRAAQVVVVVVFDAPGLTARAADGLRALRTTAYKLAMECTVVRLRVVSGDVLLL